MKKLFVIIMLIFFIFLFFGCTIKTKDDNQSGVITPQTRVTGQQTAKIAWQSAMDVAIVHWAVEENVLIIVVKNNSYQTLTLDRIKIDYIEESNINIMIAPGSTREINLDLQENCPIGKVYNFDKEKILLEYYFGEEEKIVQEGAANIMGNCE
jgi:hypothetical protein